MSNTDFKLGYRPELDGVRGISILLVLCLHFLPTMMPGGYLGVDIFFVLSGFLITTLLLEEWARRSSISLKHFYIRRALRLGPALLTYLLALCLYAALFLQPGSAQETYLGALLTLSYVSNWVIALAPNFPLSILAITWSLAVEEQFYLVWPILLTALLNLKHSRRWIIGLLIAGIMAIASERYYLWSMGASVRRLYYATDTHADGLLVGCLLGCLASWNFMRERALSRLLLVPAVAAIAFIGYLAATTYRTNPLLYQGGYSLVAIAIGFGLAYLIARPDTPLCVFFRFPALVWIGRISYGLYLWHWPVRGLVFGSSSQPSWKQVVAGIALSFLITALSFYLIEQPFLRWKRKFTRASATDKPIAEAI